MVSQMSNRNDFIILTNFAARCINPLLLLSDNYLALTAQDDSHPIGLVGSNISFTCNGSSNLFLSGPNKATCAENGEWEPDPRQIKCKGMQRYMTCLKQLYWNNTIQLFSQF